MEWYVPPGLVVEGSIIILHHVKSVAIKLLLFSDRFAESAGTRLRQREVLHIFSDIAKGVARLHHRTKPVIHRDLKVCTIEL